MINIFDKKTSYKEALLGNGLYDLTKLLISAETTEDISGNYELNLEIDLMGDAPTDLYEMLQVDNIIKVNDEGSEELFRIAQVNKGLDFIEVYCRHITISDSLNLWLDNVRPTNLDGMSALQWLAKSTVPQCNLLLTSDIATQATANYVRKNLYEALFDGDNAFISRWGGEIKRTGYTININTKIGQDKTKLIKIKEALNLTEFNAKSNIDEVSTVIYPIGFDGITADRVESPLINNYSMEFPIEIKYEDVKVKKKAEEGQQQEEEGFDTLEEAQAELIKRATKEFTDNHLDKIKFECDIDYIDLEKYEEYKDIGTLQKAFLGDYITVRVDTFDMDITARIVARKYDVLRNKRLENTISTEGTLKKPENIRDIIKDMFDKIDLSEQFKDLGGHIDSLIQQGFKSGYVIYDTNACYAVDKLPKEQAKNVVVLNNGGLGFSSTGINGPYKYGFTIDGKINADMITVGAMSGQYIKAGTIEASKLSTQAIEEITKGMVTEHNFTQMQIDIDGLKTSVGTVESNVGAIRKEFDGYKTQVNNRFDGLANDLNNFENVVNGAFKDGIIDETEAKILKDRINAAGIEKEKVDDEFTRLYNHANLSGTSEKTFLYNAKQEFDRAYNSLISTITQAIQDSKISYDENQNVINATNTFKTTLGAYRQAYTSALNKVGEKYSQLALQNANSYTNSKITQTAGEIRAEIQRVERKADSNTNSLSSLSITTDSINSKVSKVENKVNGFDNRITANTQRIGSLEINTDSITSKVSQVENKVDRFDDRITSNTQRIQTAEQKITPSAIISTVSSTITQAKNEAINSANNSTDNKLNNYATKTQMSSLRQDIEGFEFKVSSTGPYNLLKNSRPLDLNMDFWYTNNGGDAQTTYFKGVNHNSNMILDGERFGTGFWWEGQNAYSSGWTMVCNSSLVNYRFATNKNYTVDFIIYSKYADNIQVQICDSDASNGVYFSDTIYLYGSQYKRITRTFSPRTEGNRPIFRIASVDKNGQTYGYYIPWVNLYEGEHIYDKHLPDERGLIEGITTIDSNGVKCKFDDGTYAQMGRDGFKYKHPNWEHPYQYLTKVLKVAKKRNGYWHKFYLGDEFKGKQMDRDFKLTHYIGAVDCNAYVETGQYGGALRTSFTEVRNWNSSNASIEARCCIQKITLKTEVMFGWDRSSTDTNKGGIIGESAGDIIIIAQM